MAIKKRKKTGRKSAPKKKTSSFRKSVPKKPSGGTGTTRASDGTVRYYRDGVLHNDKGPAVYNPKTGEARYVLKGKQVTKDKVMKGKASAQSVAPGAEMNRSVGSVADHAASLGKAMIDGNEMAVANGIRGLRNDPTMSKKALQELYAKITKGKSSAKSREGILKDLQKHFVRVTRAKANLKALSASMGGNATPVFQAIGALKEKADAGGPEASKAKELLKTFPTKPDAQSNGQLGVWKDNLAAINDDLGKIADKIQANKVDLEELRKKRLVRSNGLPPPASKSSSSAPAPASKDSMFWDVASAIGDYFIITSCAEAAVAGIGAVGAIIGAIAGGE